MEVIFDTHSAGRASLDTDAQSLFELLGPAVFDDRTSDSALTVLNWLVQWGFEIPQQTADPVLPHDRDLSECGFAGWAPSAPAAGRCTSPLPLSSLLPVNHRDPAPEEFGPWWTHLLPEPAPQAAQALRGVGVALAYWAAGERDWSADWQRTGPPSTTGSFSLTDDALMALANVQNPEGVSAETLRELELTAASSDLGFLRRLADQPWDLMGMVGLRVPLSSIYRIRCWQHVVTKAALFDRKSKALIAERGYGLVDAAGICVEFSDGWRPLALELRLPEFPQDEGADSLYAFAAAVTRAAVTSRLSDAAVHEADRQALEALPTGQSPLSVIRAPQPGSKLGQHGYLVHGAELPGSRPISVPREELERPTC